LATIQGEAIKRNPIFWVLLLSKKIGYGFCQFEYLLLGSWKSFRTGKKFTNLLAKVKQADLKLMANLADEGKIKPYIQQSFTLDEVPQALDLLINGKVSGKLAISN
jgi:NADPH:quinone reductase-like Zn-dependent oxidoreductase